MMVVSFASLVVLLEKCGSSLADLSGLHTANLSWQTLVGKLKLVCVNGISRISRIFSHSRRLWPDSLLSAYI